VSYPSGCWKYPETASFLTTSEREYIVQLLKKDSHDQRSSFEWKFFWQAVTDYKTYLQIMVYMGCVYKAIRFQSSHDNLFSAELSLTKPSQYLSLLSSRISDIRLPMHSYIPFRHSSAAASQQSSLVSTQTE